VCGDSFTYGGELDDRTLSWPNLLANRMNATLNDTSQRGSSNQRIVYHTTKHFANNYDLYIIAWSEYARFTFYKSDNDLETAFTPSLANEIYEKESYFKDWGKTLYKHWYNELFAFKQWLQQIILLQNLLRDRKVIMLNTFPNNLEHWLADESEFISSVKHLINFNLMNDEQILAEHKEIQYYINLIDTSIFYKWRKFFIAQLCIDHEVGPGGHFLDAGHAKMAKLIYDYA